MHVDLRVHLHVREWAPQHEEMHRQWAGGFRFQSELIGDVAYGALMGITLAIVDDRLYHPLVIERGKPRRLVE